MYQTCRSCYETYMLPRELQWTDFLIFESLLYILIIVFHELFIIYMLYVKIRHIVIKLFILVFVAIESKPWEMRALISRTLYLLFPFSISVAHRCLVLWIAWISYWMTETILLYYECWERTCIFFLQIIQLHVR